MSTTTTNKTAKNLQAGDVIGLRYQLKVVNNQSVKDKDGNFVFDTTQPLQPCWGREATLVAQTTRIIATEIVKSEAGGNVAVITCDNGQTYRIYCDALRYVTFNNQ
jgi:hypothetical protein